MNVRTLVVLVATCAAVFWAWRTVREADPIRTAARGLHSRHAAQRRASARLLGEAKVEEAGQAIPELLEAVHDDDPEVRAGAVRGLTGLVVAVGNAPRARPPATVADPETFAARFKQVGPAFLAALSDQAPEVRAAAAAGLHAIVACPAASATRSTRDDLAGWVERSGTVGALVAAMTDTDEQVGLEAGRALGAIGRTFPVAAPGELVKRLGDPDLRTRGPAFLTLVEFTGRDETLLPVLFRTWEREQDARGRKAYDTAFTIGPPVPPPSAVPALVEALSSRDFELRSAAAWLLGEMGPSAEEAVPALLEALKREAAQPTPDDYTLDSPSLLNRFAYALNRINRVPPEAVDVVAGVFHRSDAVKDRARGAVALGRLGKASERLVPELIGLVRPETDPLLLEAAVSALGDITPGTPSSDPALAALERLKQSRPDLFSAPRAMFVALARLRSPSFTPPPQAPGNSRLTSPQVSD
jgi:HEAT repeat protein